MDYIIQNATECRKELRISTYTFLEVELLPAHEENVDGCCVHRVSFSLVDDVVLTKANSYFYVDT